MARILVADDNVEQITVQRKLFEALGYEVDAASSPAATVEAVRRRVPDLVVMDLRFPKVSDGLGLIRALRESFTGLKVIVLSGWPDDLYGTPEETMVDRIVVKGSMRELLGVISEFLQPKAVAASALSRNLP